MLFKEHQVHFNLEEYNTIWTCSNCSPVKCGKSDIVSFTSEVQIYEYIYTYIYTYIHTHTQKIEFGQRHVSQIFFSNMCVTEIRHKCPLQHRRGNRLLVRS
jgi:hypothetical protein